jgi:hypothetical protein
VLDRLVSLHSALSRPGDEEDDRYFLRGLQESIEPALAVATWRAYRRTVLDSGCAAAELDPLDNAALLAKSRVLRRSRQEARGPVD